MKQFFVFMLLVVATFSYQAVANSAAVESIDVVVSMEDVRYVIVYKQNGVIHAVIVNHYVDCQAQADVGQATGFYIVVDCGPLNSVFIPNDAVNVSEEEALNDMGLEEWAQ